MRASRLAVPEGEVQRAQQFAPDGSEPFTVAPAVASIFDRDPDVTAILCGTDAIAMRVCRARRRRVPDDVSVVGFDEPRLLTEAMDPPPTSVALPYEVMRQAAGGEAARRCGQ